MAGKGTIGAKLVLEGESQYKAALKEIKSAHSELRSEMKLCSSEFKSSQNSITALQTKYDILGKQVETAQKKYDVYATALNDAKKAQSSLGEALSQAQSKYDAAAKAMEEMEKSSTATNEELEEQKKKVESCAQEVADAQSKYDACSKKVNDYQTSLNYAGAELAEFKNDQEQTAKYLKEAESATDKCATSIDEFGKEVKEAETSTSTFGDVLKANLASEAIIAGVGKLVEGIKSVASACIDTGMAFEKSMSTVEALSGATGQDLEDLTNKAREMGAATLYSAADAADALGYMALAGWNTKQMLEGIEPVMNLAIASDMDLAEASDIVTDYITAFGLTVADSTKFVDEMAFAMSSSNTNTEQLGEAYKNCAATAGSLGYTVEDTTAALMVMANAGVKGGEAGTGLSTIMTRLATDTKDCATELEKYGVSVYDSQGNMNSLSSILIGMGGIWEDLTDKEQANLAKIVAGTSQYSKLQTIMLGMNEAAKEGGTSFEDYTKALEECDGTAAQMAETMGDNLQGAIWNLESSLEAVEETVYSALTDSLQEGVGEAADALTQLDNALKYGDAQVSLARLSDAMEGFVESSADLATDILPGLIDGLAFILENASTIAGGITGIATAIGAYNTVTKVAGDVSRLFGLALPTSQIALVASLLTGAAAALAVWKATAEKSDGEKITKEMESLKESLEGTAEARETDRQEMVATESTVKSLVRELENENTSTKRKKQIVEELNAALPDLNLQYDEQANLLSMTADELDRSTEAMIRQMKVAAAEEDLTEIINDQYQAEKELASIQEEIADKYGVEADSAEEVAEALRKMAEEQDAYNDSWTTYTGMPSNLGDNAEDMLAYADAIDIANESINGLTEEYEAVEEYINANTEQVDENTAAMDENAAAAEAMGATATQVSEELQEAYKDAFEDIRESLGGATEDFQTLGQQAMGTADQTTASFSEIKQSMEEWAAGVDSYADSVAIAETIMSADSNSAAYLQSLIDKGPSAAAELDAVTAAYDDNRAAFDELVDTYNQTNQMLDNLSQMEAGFSTGYTDMYNAGLEAIAENAPLLTDEMTANFDEQTALIDEKTAEMQDALTNGYAAGSGDQTAAIAETTTAVAQEGIIDPLNETLGVADGTSTETTTVGESVDQGLIDGQENLHDDVTTTSETLATDVYNAFADGLASSKFQTLGDEICNGLVTGINNGSGKITSAARSAAEEAYQAAKRALDVNSPSRKFAWLGEMSGEGYTEGLIESMENVDTIMANATSKAIEGSIRGSESVTVAGASSANTFGDVNITVYGAQGQNVNELADIVMDKINTQFVRSGVAFG